MEILLSNKAVFEDTLRPLWGDGCRNQRCYNKAFPGAAQNRPCLLSADVHSSNSTHLISSAGPFFSIFPFPACGPASPRCLWPSRGCRAALRRVAAAAPHPGCAASASAAPSLLGRIPQARAWPKVLLRLLKVK